MNIYQLKDLSNEDRQTVFLGEAAGCEDQVYQRILTPEELAAKKDEMADAIIMQSKMEEDFAKQKSLHKKELEPILQKRKQALSAIRNKFIEETGKVWRLPDYEHGMMNFIADDGRVLNSRPMYPEERQYRMTTLNKAM